jgi:signal transduction histidine kinase
MHPDSVQGGREVKGKSTLRRRFITALIVYTGIILVLWIVFQNITLKTIGDYARENTYLAADDWSVRVGAEFSQMRTITSAIVGSAFVQDFLKERDAAAYYEKAELVSEIIQKAAFPITNADSIITFSTNGKYYRFSGGLSNASCEELYRTFQNADTVFTVIELDDTLFFCHNSPVFDMSGQSPVRAGNVVMLTGLEKTRRMLEYEEITTSIDMALVFGGEIILSNNPAIEGMAETEIEPMYGLVSTAPVAGTALSVAAAIPNDALFPENTLYFIMAATLLFLLLLMILVLYRYLSAYMIQPMEKNLYEAEISKLNMRMGLLAAQMDAHFVVNTLQNVKRLSDIGENEKAGRMSEGLAAILKHWHAGDVLVNVFDDFQILAKYIDIMNIKFDEQFTVEYQVEDNLETCLMPGLILQPIVENALMHGLGGKERDARLDIRGFIRDNSVIFEIYDNGAGIPQDKLRSIQDSLAQSELGDFPKPGLRGVALTNIQRRIRIKCGEGYGVTIDSALEKGTTVTVTLPLISDE